MIEESVTVTVRAPFQVFHEGVAHTPGETLTVPYSVAAAWAGFVDVDVDTTPPAKPAA